MKVWAVFHYNGAEEDLVAIFSTEEKAKEFCAEHDKSLRTNWGPRFWYEDWKVD